MRRLQLMVDLALQAIGQDDAMNVEEAVELAASARRAPLRLFPDKELAYGLIYRPRFQGMIEEKYGARRRPGLLYS